MNKKILSLLCAAAIAACSLCACGQNDKAESSETEKSSSESAQSASSETDEPSETDISVTDSETTAESDITPAMWKVNCDNGAVVTLVGSMHALEESDYPLPQKMMDAFNDSDILAVEADLASGDSITFQSALLASMYYDDPDDSLDKHISKEAYDALSDYLAQFSLDLSMYKHTRPWAVGNIADTIAMQESGLSGDIGIDRYFLDKAREDGKEIFEVEGIEFQMDLLMNFSDDIYDMLFRGYKGKTKEDQLELLMTTHEAWATGDTDTIEKIDSEEKEVSETDAALMEEYSNQFLYDRNKVMTEAAENFINEGKDVFFIVGAAHFVGEKGIIALLENDGYTVERIEY
ncbi:TraB/GumN family protein [Ruminococcus albus]|uniref:GumN protein n=1 Tax=Ruminococcus albus 8 TaxID=246199 RepID=E9SG37_RUMAL|nr:TraB/GumN family protein [Ruminococcus albus]EGC01791.1 GumN protein [Ruminococcus albus 8]MCC3352676.1 TraB/GumN family protein [Ruminococcus albus 8]